MSNKTQRKAPAFQLYVDDFLAGTSEMTSEEVGGYIRLLCHQWTKGGIPDDEDRAGRMAGLLGSPSLRYVLAKFEKDPADGLLKNKRLESVRSEKEAYIKGQRESGLKGALARWGDGKSDSEANGKHDGELMATPLATPLANGCRNDGSPSPSPSPDKDLNKDLDILSIMGTKVPRPKFKKPSLEDVRAEMTDRGMPEVEAEKFMDFYDSNGWKVSRAPMADWKAAVRNWVRNKQERSNAYHPRQIGTVTPSDAPF